MFDKNTFLTVCKQEQQRNARMGKPSFEYLSTINLFFRYIKEKPETKIEQWFDFCNWIDQEFKPSRHQPFMILSHLTKGELNYQKSRHKENVSCRIELPSEEGFWKYLKQLSIFANKPENRGKLNGITEGTLICNLKIKAE